MATGAEPLRVTLTLTLEGPPPYTEYCDLCQWCEIGRYTWRVHLRDDKPESYLYACEECHADLLANAEKECDGATRHSVPRLADWRSASELVDRWTSVFDAACAEEAGVRVSPREVSDLIVLVKLAQRGVFAAWQMGKPDEGGDTHD